MFDHTQRVSLLGSFLLVKFPKVVCGTPLNGFPLSFISRYYVSSCLEGGLFFTSAVMDSDRGNFAVWCQWKRRLWKPRYVVRIFILCVY